MQVGIDLIEIDRVRRALERYTGFAARCFTEAERAYCDSKPNPAQHYAARFAGKEAVGKALGCGVLFTWREIEIAGRPKPSVRLAGRTKAWAEKVRAGSIDLSMSHSKGLATAVCLVSDRMLEPLYTAGEMRMAEELYSGTVEELMKRAGRAVAACALEDFGDSRSFTVVCGSGSNGGDGRIAAAALEEAGKEVLVVDAKPEDEEKDLGDPDLVIDALFGTGFEGEPRPGAARLIEQMNELGAPVLAVDLPSGVDASTGEVAGSAVDADLTVTFHGEKVGHYVTPGAYLAGYIEVADIGLEPIETEHARLTRDVLDLVPRRSPTGNKYSSGHVVVIGGSPGLTGAPCLSALAALRADAGYVTLAGPEPALGVFERWVLEAVKRPLPVDGDGLLTEAAVEPALRLAERAGALAVGPGLGRSEGTKAFVRRLLAEGSLPAVVDGDALWELEPGEWPAPRVLTPHSGELGRLIGEDSSWVDAHRAEAVRRAVERFGCVVLLKGSGTLIGAPGEGILVDGGFPTLATAGTGDVLTGIVGSFLAKGMEARVATAAAATAHHWAAINAPYTDGLIASDLLESLPAALSP